MKQVHAKPELAALTAACAAFTAFFAFFKVMQIRYLHVGAFDYAFYDQALRTTLDGRGLLLTTLYGEPTLSILAFHSTFTHVLLAPLYGLFPRPETLSILQTALFSSAAFPLYWTAEKRLGARPALLLALAYLLHPVVVNCQLLGYYATRAFPTPLLVWSLWALAEEKTEVYLALAVTAAACDEATAVVVCGLGLLDALRARGRARARGAVLAAASLVYAVYVVRRLQPHFGNDDPFGPLRLPGFPRAAGLPALAGYIFSHPAEMIGRLFEPRKAVFLLKLFAPVAFCALLSPAPLLPALPVFFVSLLLTPRWLLPDEAPSWAALTVPFVFFAGIEGVDVLRRRLKPGSGRTRAATRLCALGLLLGVAAHALADRPGIIARFLFPDERSRRRAEDLRGVLAELPGEAAVAAGDTALPFLTERRRLYALTPAGLAAKPDWVLADRLCPSAQMPGPEPEKAFEALLRSLADDRGYRRIDARGDFSLYRRIP